MNWSFGFEKKSDFYETFSGSEEGIIKVLMNANHLKEKKIKELVTNSNFLKWSLVFVAQKVLPIKFFTFFFHSHLRMYLWFFFTSAKIHLNVSICFFQMQHLGIVFYNFKWVQIICSRHLTLFYLTVTGILFKERIKMYECNKTVMYLCFNHPSTLLIK